MPHTRRTLIGAASAGLAAAACAATGTESGQGTSTSRRDATVQHLLAQSLAANTALMRGDIRAYRVLAPYTENFTLMSPFGGEPTHVRDMTPERWAAMGRFFRNGTFEQEVVQSYATDDMVVLAIIERCRVEVGGLPHQEWPLRVTLVYRRDGGDWRLAHRHADPLVAGVRHATAAALARGDIS
jgi:ketosteroid isomerase-like protein